MKDRLRKLVKTFAAAALVSELTGCGSLPGAGDLNTREPAPKRQAYSPSALFSDAAQTIHDICTEGKLVLIIDSFSLEKPDFGVQLDYHTKDVNGDGIDDMSHGDIVARRARSTGMKAITFGLGGHGEKKESTKLPKGELVRALTFILAEIEKGTIPKPDAVIFALSKKKTFPRIHAVLGRDLALTPDNIAEKADEMVARIYSGPTGIKGGFQKDNKKIRRKNRYGKNNKTLAGLRERARLIQAYNGHGIAVFTPSGNDGNNKKLNTLAPMGAPAIASLNHDGSQIASYSALSAAVVGYAIGDLVSYADPDGNIYFDKGGPPIFLAEELSNGKPLALRFNNQPYYFDPDTMEIEGGRFMTVKEYYEQRGASAENMDALIAQYGDVIFIPNRRNGKPGRPVDGIKLRMLPKDNNGRIRLVFDPTGKFFDEAGNKDESTDLIPVAFRMGTSYALPSMCGHSFRHREEKVMHP